MISTVDHHRTPLLDQLSQQAQTLHYRFYMPGHKGGRGSSNRLIKLMGHQSLMADIPELPELDQLFAPSGVIKEAQALAADAFGADQTYFLINGTSVGLMAAIMTVCNPGEQIIVPRNCHQSILNGLILAGAHPIWVYPEFESDIYIPHCLSPAQLEIALHRFPQAKAAIAVSPTYEGICGDIQHLAAIAHQHHIPLIIDEAHGAHLGFHPNLPPSALSQGADLVVQSSHKTLGALTQASMLHTQGDRINPRKLQTHLTLLQSSSPNYLLLASLDAARQQIATQGNTILGEAIELSSNLRGQLQNLSKFQLLDTPSIKQPGFIAIDPFKLTLKLANFSLSGFELDEELNQKYQILAELPTEQSITFMLGQGNSRQELEHLFQSLNTLGDSYPAQLDSTSFRVSQLKQPPILSAITPREAVDRPSKVCSFDNAVGQLSAKAICPYPPGIPIIFPGEEITQDAIASLMHIQNSGNQIIGIPKPTLNILEVIDM